MPNSKCVIVVDLALIFVVALVAAGASSGQGDRNDAKTKKIRIVTVVKRTGIGWFERMEGYQTVCRAEWRRRHHDRRGRC